MVVSAINNPGEASMFKLDRVEKRVERPRRIGSFQTDNSSAHTNVVHKT